jgi:hypothetical protein
MYQYSSVWRNHRPEHFSDDKLSNKYELSKIQYKLRLFSTYLLSKCINTIKERKKEEKRCGEEMCKHGERLLSKVVKDS